MEQCKQQRYTVEYIENLPEDVRVELIDGVLYDMATPSTKHQSISTSLLTDISLYIRNKGGSCRVFHAPFAVYLDDDAYTYVEPDIVVICNPDKLDNRGYHGAPDWIIEITSPGSFTHDSIVKLNKYFSSGVKLYWIVNPMKRTVTVWTFENGVADSTEYPFSGPVPVSLYPDLSLTISE